MRSRKPIKERVFSFRRPFSGREIRAFLQTHISHKLYLDRVVPVEVNGQIMQFFRPSSMKLYFESDIGRSEMIHDSVVYTRLVIPSDVREAVESTLRCFSLMPNKW